MVITDRGSEEISTNGTSTYHPNHHHPYV